MKLPSPEIRRCLIVVPFLLLYFWLRIEPHIHNHAFVLFLSAVLFFSVIPLLLKIIEGKPRFAVATLWFAIACLLLVEFFQLMAYREYSDLNFQREAERSTKIVQERTLRFLELTRNRLTMIQDELRQTAGMNPGSVQIRLQEKFGNVDYWWGVYREGRLLAWKGRPRNSEDFPAYGAEEISVYNALHQQFLKVKREMSVQEDLYYVVVMLPIAADYGAENYYLRTYNRITDGLPVQPRLLYTSSESTTGSPDLKIVSVNITEEFSISAVYDKQHYGQMLQARFDYLHWWIECLGLAFLVYTSVILTFTFVGFCGPAGCPGLIPYWLSFLLCSLLAVLTVGLFSVFGTDTLFNTRTFHISGYGNIFHTPGHLIFTAFFALNAAFSLVLLFRRLNLHLKGNNRVLRIAALFIASFLTGYLFLAYFKLQKEFVAGSVIGFQPFSFEEGEIARDSTAFGLVWLDLAFTVVIALVFSFFMRKLPFSKWKGLAVGITQLVAFVSFFSIYRPHNLLSLWPAAALYLGISIFVYFVPRLWRWFEHVNLFTRFIATVVLCSAISFLFYFGRFNYEQSFKRRYIERVAALQVYEIRKDVQDAVRISLQDLDVAIESISLDARIPDVAYRLWLRTELARRGLRSAVSLYGLDGELQSRFSLALPSLNIDVVGRSAGNEWDTKSADVLFGTIKKPILISVRLIGGSNYLVVEALANHENLSFVPSISPFQELFRVRPERPGAIVPNINVYDSFWHPVYQSNPDVSPRIDKARNVLENSRSTWICEASAGQSFDVYYFRLQGGFAALAVPVRRALSHLVLLTGLVLLNFFWLFAFTLTFVFFFKPYLMLHFQEETPIRFSFFQKMLIAFVLFSIVPLVSLTALIRNYVWEKRTAEVTDRALNSFSVVSETITQYLYGPGSPSLVDSPLDSSVAELLGQVVKQDVSFFLRRDLIASSREELYDAGFLGGLIDGKADVDLTLRGQKHSVSEMQIGNLKYLNLSGRIYRGKVKQEMIISIPFQIEERSVEREIIALKEYMVLAGAGLVLLSVFLGWFLASRFTRPVHVLIEGTAEMARGNLQHRITEIYRDEFLQLVRSFNAMAASLDQQRQTLDQRRAYIENILNNITTAVISIDSTMSVATINPAAIRMFGTDPNYNGPLSGLIGSAGGPAELQNTLDEFIVNSDQFQIKEVSLFLTNREVNFRVVYVPLFDDERKWTGAIVLVEDISDIIRSNRLSAWAEMARRVAHEVKNPLTPIQLAVEHLLRVWEDRSPSFEQVLNSCAEAILRQVKALRRLVSDFSQYGRPSILEREEVKLDQFLQDLTMSYGLHLPEGIRIETKIDPGLPPVKVDIEKIRGALMNIIENGLQAIDGQGQIVISTDRGPNGFVRIRIHDSGRGVPSEILPRLFEPYFSTKSGGSGLGLPIARKNIEEHGGRIEVQSKQGTGTTVTVLLPEARVQETTMSPRAPS